MPRVLHEIKQKDGFLIYPPPPPSSFSSPYYSTNNEQESTPSSSFSRISPVLLLIIIILAAIFFITGLLHLLVRFFLKRPSFSAIYHSNRYPDTSRSHSFQRQLQQLFRLHDSGLDQAFIDALPVFYYKDIMGLKEPFDCAVCLCEFADQDKLRLLPTCSHAFHINCIDTWLLSNSTCPLCRGTLSSSNLPVENPLFNFDISREISNGIAIASDVENGLSCGKKPANMEETVGEKKVFSVRLGKFRSMNGAENGAERGQGEISSSSSSCHLDARRCYSMGTFQYVVGDSNLQVAFSHDRGGGGGGGVKFVEVRGDNGCSAIEGDVDEKKISGRTRGESFSVSKIWLWSKKSKYSSSSYTHMGVPPLSVSWPVNDRTET